MELVVPAVSRAVHRRAVAAFLQHSRAVLDRHPILLLVSAPVGPHRGRAHGGESFRRSKATPRVTNKNGGFGRNENGYERAFFVDGLPHLLAGARLRAF